jgi:hypothetical protein
MLPATGRPPTVRKAGAQDKILPLAETWAAPADFAHAREPILRRASAQTTIQVADGVTIFGVALSPTRTIGIIASPRAKPHVDADFPEWSALWVLQAHGHRLSTADHVPIYSGETTRRPLRSPGLVSVPLDVDSIVLFNAHRTHWMDAVPGRPRPVLFAASFDFPERPSHQAVEDRIRSELIGLGPDRSRGPSLRSPAPANRLNTH